MDVKLLKYIPVIQDTDVANKICLVRTDFNVPVKDGKVVDNARIVAAKKTIDYLIKSRARIILLSHFSRIKSVSDIKSGKKSLYPVAKELKKLYPKMKIIFVKNNLDPRLPSLVKNLKANEIMLLENTRYNDVCIKTGKVIKRESGNDAKLAKFWASLADVYVNDAFATIHRGHASNAGIASQMKQKCIGFLIQQELENVSKLNEYATRPIISVIGGAKISDKISLLEKILKISDQVLIGGAMANTFVSALGINLGKSLIEPEMKNFAKNLYEKYTDKIILPIDFLVSKKPEDTKTKVASIKDFPANMSAYDIGPKSIRQFSQVIRTAKTLFWNGPTGLAEFKPFSKSSSEIAKQIAYATVNGGFSLIGGGDTIAIATKFVDRDEFSYVSTGGGATLAVIADEKLPGIFYSKKKKI